MAGPGSDDRSERASVGVATAASDPQAAEVAVAARSAARLAALARTVVHSGLVPHACDNGHACPLGGCAQTGACAVARRLAASGHAGTQPGGVHADDPWLACRRFVDALARAGAAVYVCRRVLHARGECLFADGGDDLCGWVLAAAHQLGGQQRTG